MGRRARTLTGLSCSVCGELQFNCGNGNVTCSNGHGGAESVGPQEAQHIKGACHVCKKPFPPDGGYAKGSLRTCSKTCMREAEVRALRDRHARIGSTPRYIAGLDLSINASAVCIIPRTWDQKLGPVKTFVSANPKLPNDAPEDDRLDRYEKNARCIADFLWHYPIEAIYFEQYAFSQGQSKAHALGENGGIIKSLIRQKVKLTPEAVVASSARKTLLGKCPNSGAKEYVRKNVRRLEGSAREWGDDEIDAFVIANHGLMLCGGVAMTFEGVP